jgi:hypothetical protein
MNILRWIDIGVNVWFLMGSFDETISERAARARNGGKRWGCVLCRVLDRVLSPKKRDHCDTSLMIRIGDKTIRKNKYAVMLVWLATAGGIFLHHIL